MADRIQPGAYVRVASGMYAGAEGRVVSLDVGGNGPWATLDVGEAQPIAAYVSALELVGATSTVEQERDDAIAERDRLRARVSELEALSDATMVATEIDRLLTRILDVQEDAARAQQERDRLRRELESLRDECSAESDQHAKGGGFNASLAHARCAARLDAILRGES